MWTSLFSLIILLFVFVSLFFFFFLQFVIPDKCSLHHLVLLYKSKGSWLCIFKRKVLCRVSMWSSWDFPFETQDSIIECLEIISFNWQCTMSKWTEIGSFNTEIKGFSSAEPTMTFHQWPWTCIFLSPFFFYNLNKHQIYTCCVTQSNTLCVLSIPYNTCWKDWSWYLKGSWGTFR